VPVERIEGVAVQRGARPRAGSTLEFICTREGTEPANREDEGDLPGCRRAEPCVEASLQREYPKKSGSQV
jgi:hypothetical protein